MLALLLSAAPAEPIRLDPKNPHYFLFHGKAVALISSGEHYGAVMNADFDYHRYLATLEAEGMNYTRLFGGSYRELPAQVVRHSAQYAGARARTIHRAVGASDTPGYEGGGNKFDLDRWNPEFFARYRDFLSEAAKRGIVVEVTLFSSHYQEMQWKISALNPANNVNGTDAIDWKKLHTLENGNILAHQERYTRKLVREANAFDNVIFEIQNEPWSDRTVLASVVNPYLELPRAIAIRTPSMWPTSFPWRGRRASRNGSPARRRLAEQAPDRAELLQFPVSGAPTRAGSQHRELPLCVPGGGHAELRAGQSDVIRRNRLPGPRRCRLPAAGVEFHAVRRQHVRRPRLLVQRGPRGRHRYGAERSRRRQPGVPRASLES